MLDAFFHSQQSHALSAGGTRQDRVHVESGPVVADDQVQRPIALAQDHVDAPGLGILGRIVNGFFHDAKTGGFQIQGQARLDRISLQLYARPPLRCLVLSPPFQCRDQPQIIEQGGSQIQRNAADSLKQAVDDPDAALQR